MTKGGYLRSLFGRGLCLERRQGKSGRHSHVFVSWQGIHRGQFRVVYFSPTSEGPEQKRVKPWGDFCSGEWVKSANPFARPENGQASIARPFILTARHIRCVNKKSNVLRQSRGIPVTEKPDQASIGELLRQARGSLRLGKPGGAIQPDDPAPAPGKSVSDNPKQPGAPHAHRIKRAVETVRFVLHDARVGSFRCPVDALSLRVASLVAQTPHACSTAGVFSRSARPPGRESRRVLA